jgi:hypothetical protein
VKRKGRLNQRQWVFLQAIFDEAALHGRSVSMPAGWHWIPSNAADAPLLQRLRQAGVCDPGTGLTFAALERRGLIRYTYQRISPLGEPILFVQLIVSQAAAVQASGDALRSCSIVCSVCLSGGRPLSEAITRASVPDMTTWC